MAASRDRIGIVCRSALGPAVLAFGLWRYGDVMLVPPLRAAIAGGHSASMLRDFGGPLTGNDFAHIYAGSWALWRGLDPYDPAVLLPAGQAIAGRGVLPYVYLPFTGLVLGPLAALPYGDAFLAWFLANHLMLWLAVLASFAALGLRWTWRSAAFAVLSVSISYPLFRTLSAGQLNVALALGYALFWLALARRAEWLAGFMAAFLTLFKLSPGVLGLYLLWTRRWRAAGWAAIWASLLLLVSIAWTGPGVHLAFLPVLRDMGYGRSTWAQFGQHFYCDEANQSFNALFHHLFAANPVAGSPLLNLGAGFANGLTWAVSLGLLALVLLLTRPGRAGRDPGADPLGYSLFIFLSLFLPSLCWDHCLVQLLFPTLAMFQRLEQRRALPTAVLFILSLLVVSFPFNFWDERWKSGAGLFIMSWKLWGAAGLFAVNALLFVRQGSESEAKA